jgi:hypothetical protein
MTQAPDYKILEDWSSYKLEKEVIKLMQLGYVPIGGVSSYTESAGFMKKEIFIQAMYLAGNKAKA